MTDVDPIGPIPTWFVMFTGDGRRRYLIDWLQPLDCQHVLAFAYDASGERWIIYDVNRGGTAIVAMSSRQFDAWLLDMMAKRARVLKADVQQAPRVWFRFGAACVGAVRHLLGARSWAVRPIGLYRDLRRAGAQLAFEPEADNAAP